MQGEEGGIRRNHPVGRTGGVRRQARRNRRADLVGPITLGRSPDRLHAVDLYPPRGLEAGEKPQQP